MKSVRRTHHTPSDSSADDVFKTIQKFQQGRMTKQEAIKELRYAKPNDQIAFRNDTVIRACLKFVRSYRLEVRG